MIEKNERMNDWFLHCKTSRCSVFIPKHSHTILKEQSRVFSSFFDQILFFLKGTICETSSLKNTFWGRLSSKANELRPELRVVCNWSQNCKSVLTHWSSHSPFGKGRRLLLLLLIYCDHQVILLPLLLPLPLLGTITFYGRHYGLMQ